MPYERVMGDAIVLCDGTIGRWAGCWVGCYAQRVRGARLAGQQPRERPSTLTPANTFSGAPVAAPPWLTKHMCMSCLPPARAGYFGGAGQGIAGWNLKEGETQTFEFRDGTVWECECSTPPPWPSPKRSFAALPPLPASCCACAANGRLPPRGG